LTRLSPERWRVVSPYVEEALELPEDRRAEWLASLRSRDAALANDVESLFALRSLASHEGFLEGAPAISTDDRSLAGRPFGAYTLVSLIGQGGMGSVWLARRSDGRFEGLAAVKLLNASLIGRAGEERFRREGNILARLAHPHVARLLDAGVSSDGQPYLVLEHVEGESIDAYCDGHRLPVEARVALFLDVLEAVAQAHANLIVHRDIKPSNVLVDTDGQVKLLDFGIAKLLAGGGEHGAATALTDEAGHALTPEFAAPEQITGDPVTTATDVYALGTLLYLLLTARHPAGSSRRSPVEVVRAIVESEAPRASDAVSRKDEDEPAAAARATTPEGLRRQLRGDLDTILGKALKKKPTERYPSVSALSEDLRRHLRHEPVLARPDTWRYRVGKFVRRNRLGVAAAALAAVAVIAGTIVIVARGREAQRQRDAAQAQLASATAANQFLGFLLTVAAPAGRRISESGLLEKGEALVDKQFADNDALHSEMLATIGERYIAAENWDRAGRVLEHARLLARDPGARARALCPLALVKVVGGDRKSGEALISDALTRLPQEPQYTLQRATCLCDAAQFGYFTDEPEPMIRNARAALTLLKGASVPADPQRIDAQDSLAYGYYLAREYAKSDQAYAELMAALEKAGRTETMAAADALGNWCLVHFDTDLVKAEPLCRRSVELLRAVEGADGVTPTALLNYAAVLEHLARYDEAEPVYLEAIRTARSRADSQVEVVAAMELANLYAQRGDAARATGELDAFERKFRNTPAFTPRRRAGYEYSLGLVALARKDAPRALEHFRDCLTRAAALDSASNLRVLALSGSARAEIALGRPADAVDAARQAVTTAESFFPKGTPSYLVAESRALLGEAQLARGDRATARATLATAAGELSRSLGPDHPATSRAGELLASAADAPPSRQGP